MQAADGGMHLGLPHSSSNAAGLPGADTLSASSRGGIAPPTAMIQDELMRLNAARQSSNRSNAPPLESASGPSGAISSQTPA